MLLPTKGQWRKWSLPSKYTAVCTLVGLPIAVVSLVIALRGCNGPSGSNTGSPTRLLRKCPVDPNTGRTDLYAKTKARVDGVTDSLIREKVKRWLMIVGPGAKGTVTFHDGREVSYSGVMFDGSPRLVFWEGFIEPFLEDAIQQVLDEIGKECRDNAIDPSTPLAEAARCLDNMIWRVYSEMAKVDQRFRGAPSRSPIPKSIAEDVESKTKRMQAKVQGQLKAAMALYSTGG